MRRVLLAIVLLWPLLAQGAVLEEVLGNGLKVLIQEERKAPLVVVQLYYKVGAKDEPEHLAGISHLLEHMMFKGTERLGPSEYSRLIQRIGGVNNAFTTKDYTMYYAQVPSEGLELVLSLEAERMARLRLNSQEVLSERAVVMEERRLRYEDDPQSSLYEEVLAAAFKVHPYERPVIGWMQSLQNIGPQELRQHYRRFYSPGNAVLVLVGDLEAREALRLVRKHFGPLQARETAARAALKEPPQRGQRRVYLRREAELPYVLVAYHVPSFLQAPEEAAALEVLAQVLSGGRSARFFRRLVKGREVALGAFASYSSLQPEPFLFFLGGTPRAGREAEALEQAIYEEVEAVKARPPSEQELQRAKNQLEAALLMGQDSLFFQAELLGMFELMGDWRLKERYLQALRAVRAEDVSRVARKYLRKDNSTVGILIPLKKEAGHGPAH
jgi:zinc protease